MRLCIGALQPVARIRSVDSLEWVRTHDSQKFLESFYFQYGHASIADLGHVVMCFEGISEAGGYRDRRRAVVGRAGAVVALSGLCAASGFVAPPDIRCRRISGICISAAGACTLLDGLPARCTKKMIRHSSRSRLPRPDGDEARTRIRPQHCGARVRRRQLSAVLGAYRPASGR